jgi:hypothetical protein
MTELNNSAALLCCNSAEYPTPFSLTASWLTDPLEIRCYIAQAEQQLRDAIAAGLAEETEFQTDHAFPPGLYVRSVFLPKGSLLVGKLHRFAHHNYISQGKVTVLTEKHGLEILTAPCQMISPAACKRLIYAHEDTIWTVMHPNTSDTQDLELLELEHIALSYAELGLEEPSELLQYIAVPVPTCSLQGA